jgi:hypothetical protein
MAGLMVFSAGCMKCGERAMQQAAERGIESAIEKASGGKADVDVGTNVDISTLPEPFRYAGAVAKGKWTMTNEQGSGTVYALETADPAKSVVEFYKKALTGWKSVSTMETDKATMLVAASPDEKQSITVTISTEEGKTGINIIYATK